MKIKLEHVADTLAHYQAVEDRMIENTADYSGEEHGAVTSVLETLRELSRYESYAELTNSQTERVRDLLARLGHQSARVNDAVARSERAATRDHVLTGVSRTGSMAPVGFGIENGGIGVGAGYGGTRSTEPPGIPADPIFTGGGARGGHRGGGSSTRDEALRTIDRRRDVPDRVRSFMVESVETARGPERDRLARWITVSSAEAYERALSLYLTDPEHASALWTDDERQAVRRVQEEARALTLLDNSGGLLVGATTDFNIMLTSAGSVNPLRQLARIVSTTTDSWAGITSAGMSASWDAEAAEVSDDSPALGTVVVPVHKGHVYAQASWELEQDSNLGAQLAPLFADARDQVEAQGFTLGSGVGQPEGVITGVAAVPGSVVTSAATTLPLTVADVTGLQNALPARWRPRAQWMANLSVINAQRQAPLYANGPAMVENGQMLGWPINENSLMDGTVTGTANDYLLIGGDFSQYIVADRVGMSIVYNPIVLGPNRRPTSEVSWTCRWRTGGKVAVPDAFRLLNLSA